MYVICVSLHAKRNRKFAIGYSRTIIIEKIYNYILNINLLDMLAAMLDSGDLIAKLTSEMDSPPSTTNRKSYYTTLVSLDQKLNIHQNHNRWRPSWILKNRSLCHRSRAKNVKKRNQY